MRPLKHLALLALSAFLSNAETGSAVCGTCHARIYNQYRATPMARSARELDPKNPPESFTRASFDHAGSSYRYQVAIARNQYSVSFESARTGIHFTKPLAYAIGSGAKALSYLIADSGFLYESPVAYYTAEGKWGLAPGYDQYSYPYLTRPIVPGCLSCHSSFVRLEPATLNRYASPPFREGGIACERCHGDGARHVAHMQSANPGGPPEIVNPSKLAPAARDSICAQCHLTGDVRVARAGKDIGDYQPGGRLADFQTIFVRAAKPGGMTVTGHMENLAASACKRGAGERLWCGSCHDPHTVPAPAETAAWYRGKCQACHATRPCTETAAARSKAHDDCISCHMPKNPAVDAQHVVYTDHSIPRRPRGKSRPLPATDAEFVPFDGAPAAPRDLALAHAQAAVGKTAGPDRQRAIALLESVAGESRDPEVLVSLAEIYRNDGKNTLARPLYQRTLAIDPQNATAMVGLGGVLMEAGDPAGAIPLWTRALSKNAGLELVRLNLALALWQTGDHDAALRNLETALEINPAFAPARDLLRKLQ